MVRQLLLIVIVRLRLLNLHDASTKLKEHGNSLNMTNKCVILKCGVVLNVTLKYSPVFGGKLFGDTRF